VKILVVASHPDDYELGMAGAIKKHISEGDSVIAIIMSNGEAIGNTNVRKLEAIKSAKYLGIEKVYFLNFADTKIPSSIKSIRKIEEIIVKNKIDRIYTHSPRDTHQDHRNTCNAVLSAGRGIKQVLFFESPSSGVDFRPTFFVDISNYISNKIESLKIFKSLLKFKKRYLEIEAIQGGAHFRGYQCGLEYAESFEVFRFVEK